MYYFPASSAQTFFLFSISSFNNSIWTDPSLTRTYIGISPSVQRDTLIWDMQYLADTYFQTGYNGYASLGAYTYQWTPILLTKYDDAGSGDSYITRIDTPYAVTSLTGFDPNDLIQSVSATAHPLFPEASSVDFGLPGSGVSVQAASEATIYEACITPGAPYLMGTSLPNYNLFGPLFFENITFNASGSGGLSPVSINCKLKGGRTIISPTLGTDIWSDSSTAQEYRTASLQDCGFAYGAFYTIDSLSSAMANGAAGEIDRVSEINLVIHQNVNLSSTANGPERSDFQGPRWAKIFARSVTGYIKYYSASDAFNLPLGLQYEGGSLTMYFGSGFLFVMENVDFQRPVVSVSPGKGYTHTIAFVARNAPGAITRPAQGITASEFTLI